MPALPPPTTDAPWRTVWDQALYGPAGFYRRSSPRDHFRTAVHGSDLLARALLRLVRDHDLRTVVDLGAGRGELVRDLHRLAPDLALVAVEVAARPDDLPDAVRWTGALPAAVDGLVVAHEWLDNVPCHVVEVDRSGVARIVHVDSATGAETLGHAVDAAGVPPSLGAWLERWWPLDGAPPGTRAEVGTSRDRAWADVVGRVTRGLAVAVDYGHTRESRPVAGSMRSYRAGHQVPVLPDGSRDVTADVAVDAVAAATQSETLTQAAALRALGVSPARPPRTRAETAPREYLRALSVAADAAELTAEGGFGDFYWVVSTAGGTAAPFAPD
jgi:SAM-dependent MidA family methyltransferase